MGEAIARFRDVALAMRCRSDAAFIAPDHLFAGWKFTIRNLSGRLLAGRLSPAEFARVLRDAAKHAPGIKGAPSAADLLDPEREYVVNRWFSQYRRPMLAKGPTKADLDKQHAAALREAVEWGSLLPSIEKRLDALSEATLLMREMAGDAWLARYSRTKERYAKTLLRWQRAFDALARFVEQPTVAARPTVEKKQGRSRGARNRKGPGGRPEMYPLTLVRKVDAAREKYEKKQKRLKQRMQPRSQWLFDYCGDNDIDTRSTFPSKDPKQPEAWDVRAERFWRAAKKRLREPGN